MKQSIFKLTLTQPNLEDGKWYFNEFSAFNYKWF